MLKRIPVKFTKQTLSKVTNATVDVRTGMLNLQRPFHLARGNVPSHPADAADDYRALFGGALLRVLREVV